jgi:hypothetical protein
MTTNTTKLRAFAALANANSPNWCGKQDGEWTRERAMVNFAFIQAASPSAVLNLIEELEQLRKLKAALAKIDLICLPHHRCGSSSPIGTPYECDGCAVRELMETP